MPTFVIESQTYCYEDGLSDWDYHQQRQFKNRRAAEDAVRALNKRSPFTSYRLQPESLKEPLKA